jgi:hypothetical protein
VPLTTALAVVVATADRRSSRGAAPAEVVKST